MSRRNWMGDISPLLYDVVIHGTMHQGVMAFSFVACIHWLFDVRLIRLAVSDRID
jgi:hypothetical protein